MTETESAAAAPRSSSLVVGLTLLLGTGSVDAYTYLRHGHVFAEAMTGNLILVAVGTVRPEIVAFWRPLTAFAAFAVGVVASRTLAPWLTQWRAGYRVSVLILECVVFGVIGALPSSAPQWAIVVAIAFVSGGQIEAFREIEGERVTATVMTTNSMRTIDAIGSALSSRRPEDFHAARTLLTSVGAFVAGAFIGALCSLWLENRAAWIIGGIFAAAGALLIRDLVRDPAEV